MKLKHINGDTYTGTITAEDRYRVWLTTSTGRVLQIMKADIVKEAQ